MASDLPVDLLEDIFLRLDEIADLARAAAACTSFHRVVSDGGFLRCYRSLHRRPVLGLLTDKRRHFETEIFFPVQPPRRSAQAAGGFAKAADFTFSFLPEPKRWRVCDARDGRLLLTRNTRRLRMLVELEELVVYDPLHRRHVQIPAIPGDLLLSAQEDGNNEAMKFDDPLLAPAADEDEMDHDGGFQVMFTAVSETKVVVLVFSSARGQWRYSASFHHLSRVWTWSNLHRSRRYVHGCICWADDLSDDIMLVFDTREMKLSITDLPDEAIGTSAMVAVEAGDGRLGLLLLSDDDGCTVMDMYSKALEGINEPGNEWRHESSIPLIPGFFELKLHGAAEGYVLLLGFPGHKYRFDVCEEKPEAHYFTLELKTLLVEKLCVLEYDERRHSFLYASFPPPLSPPSVGNCKNLSCSLPVSTTETCEDIGLAELFC